MIVVDTQVHIWAAPTVERPWPEWGRRVDHRPGDPIGADEVLRRMDEAGVDRAILVPPSFAGDHNDTVLEAAAAHPDRLAVMGRIALEDPASTELVPGWLETPGMLGVRLVFVNGGSDRWLRDGTADWFWPVAAAAGVPVAILAPGHAEELGEIARAHPRLRMIVDHLGIPTSHPKQEPLETVVAPFLALAELPNVAMKASSLPYFTTSAYPFPDLQALVRSAVAAFGPDRVFWGSDLSRLPCAYAELVSLFTDQMPFLSPEERALILGEGILSWLGWPGEEPRNHGTKETTT